MAESLNSIGSFALTPHKVSICILINIYAPPSQSAVPFPFSSVSQHNRLGLFLLAVTKSCDDFLEPSLDELTNLLVASDGLLYDWLGQHLTSQLTSLSSPDDLSNFFSRLRNVLTTPELRTVEDDQTYMDPASHLGMFLRRCILAFNLLSFEGMCHLLTNIRVYCKVNDPAYELPEEDDFDNESESLEEDDEGLHLENYEFIKTKPGFETGSSSGEGSSFHIHTPRSLSRIVDDIQVSVVSKFKGSEDDARHDEVDNSLNDQQGGLILRSNWQIQGYLKEQADLIEQHGSSFPLNPFEAILKQLQKLAPELHYIHYLRYLNALYHEDYLSALENLHCFFDFSAGLEGIDSVSPSSPSNLDLGRYETALLCLGVMHSHFGHSKQALEALNEAVQSSQQNNDDTCLAYTLSAICNLLSEVGVSSATRITGSNTPGITSSLSTSMSAQQQLLVLLERSLKRAESLKLTRLVAFNRLAMAKFDLKYVKRPLISFGPKASSKLRTTPVSVCKELRLSSYLLSEFGSDGASLTLDGAFSTTWIKNLKRTRTSSVHQNMLENDFDTFHFGAQPNPVPGSVLQLAGSSYLLRASSWELYGSAPLVRLNALVYTTCFADAGSSTDLSLAYVKLIQHLAVFKGYGEAFTALKLAEEKFLSVSKSRIQLLKLQLLHERALHRGHLKLAQQFCDEFGVLASSVSGSDMDIKTEANIRGHLKLAQQFCDEFGVLASSVSGSDMDIKTEANIRHARTLLAAKQYSQAAAVAQSLFCTCHKFNLQVEKATVLLLVAEIHKKSGNPVLGLPYALASLSFCQSFNLDLLEASATLMLSELWLCLGPNHAKRASTLVHAKLALILGHGGLELRARANIAVAKCYLSDPKFPVSEDPDLVLEPLREATEDLQILEYHELLAEAFYLRAMVFNRLGKLQEREEAATSFKKHITALENQENVDTHMSDV